MEESNVFELCSLILIGGQSSRMGSPKYLLPIPSIQNGGLVSTPLFIHSTCLHVATRQLCSITPTNQVTLSTRSAAQADELKLLINSPTMADIAVDFVYDSHNNAGPAAGLCAAHASRPRAHVLVTGCDYPLLQPAALSRLFDQHVKLKKAVTCFVNGDGWAEPLLAIWSPTALARLTRLVEEAQGRGVGPTRMLRMLEKEAQEHDGDSIDFTMGVNNITPDDAEWLTGVNTKEDWQAAEKKLTERLGLRGTSWPI